MEDRRDRKGHGISDGGPDIEMFRPGEPRNILLMTDMEGFPS